MPGTLILDDGTEVDIDDLEVGTEIEMEDGQVFTVVDDDGDEYDEDPYDGAYAEYDEAGDYAYGKSADYGEVIAKAYQEAVTDDERSHLVADIAKSAALAQRQADEAQWQIAKMDAERELDVCISKAEEYGFAGDRTELFGVVISKMFDVLTDEELSLMDDIFKSFSDLIDDVSVGTEAEGYSEVLDFIGGTADNIVKSVDGGVTHEQAMAAAIEANPDLYSLYLAEKEG